MVAQRKIKKSLKKLTGKDLAKYIKENEANLNKDGDRLCIDTGYAKSSIDGVTKCDLPLFLKELNKIMN